MSDHLLRAGTRTSRLARWQTGHVIALLQQARPELACPVASFVTSGDRTLHRPLPEIGGKGLFTAELEQALRDGRIDFAVHSLKDLPVEDSPGLMLGAVVGRADVRDVLIARDGHTLATLPAGAVIGTSSLRRQAQLWQARPDLRVTSIRGNVETRLRKVADGAYDAVVLAAAGVTRLGLADQITEWLPLTVMLPAPGQGALGVQCRADDRRTQDLLALVDQAGVRAAVLAERSFLHHLGGGCSLPVAALAGPEEDGLALQGLVAAPTGGGRVHVTGVGADPWALGARLAREAQRLGAGELLAGV